jgi:hypothetical protein
MVVGEVAASNVWLRRRGAEIKSSFEAQQVRSMRREGKKEEGGRIEAGGGGVKVALLTVSRACVCAVARD